MNGILFGAILTLLAAISVAGRALNEGGGPARPAGG